MPQTKSHSKERLGSLHLRRKAKESLLIQGRDGDITVTIMGVCGKIVDLQIQAPLDVRIVRSEKA